MTASETWLPLVQGKETGCGSVARSAAEAGDLRIFQRPERRPPTARLHSAFPSRIQLNLGANTETLTVWIRNVTRRGKLNLDVRILCPVMSGEISAAADVRVLANQREGGKFCAAKLAVSTLRKPMVTI